MPESAPQTRILLIDAHTLFRESIARLLSRMPGLSVVAHCGSVQEGLRILSERRVDLVLLDYDLGRRTGIDFMRLAREGRSQAKVLIVTDHVEPGPAAELIRAGVNGIFLKRDSSASLAESIRGIIAGKVSFERHVFEQAMASQERALIDPQTGALTERERQVLSSLLEGLANKEIAARLSVPESSVKGTMRHLFEKTGVRTRSQLVRVALERYLVDTHDIRLI